MRAAFALLLATVAVSLYGIGSVQAGFIQPISASATGTPSANPPSVLINAATGAGGTSYLAPDPASGGSGTSWYTPDNGTSPITISFNFASATNIFSEVHMWDYYAHSPSSWKLRLFSGLGGGGTELLNYNFSFTPGPSNFATLHTMAFSDVTGALSGTLQTLNNSGNGGVGLAEFGFTVTAIPAPEPSTMTLAALGFLGLVKARRRQAKLSARKV